MSGCMQKVTTKWLLYKSDLTEEKDWEMFRWTLNQKIEKKSLFEKFLSINIAEMHFDIINEVWDNMACLIIQATNTAIPKKKVLNSLANRKKKIGKTTDLVKYSTILRKIIRNFNKIWKQKIPCTEYENINEVLKEINVKLNTNL
ncbi:9537_t:CDS:2 [Gigaspora margarita]|uniref:9537_t:CDS:1 n=1 Tax=Gigaspora margarita TaxID=4874 RepID=A0ABN7VLW9_GIGMA|nr:9537_t:CDS:2 [Gigaspora margarita]